MHPKISASAVRFFYEHAGFVQGRRIAGAVGLARAEQYARARGFTFEWRDDPDGDLGDHGYWCDTEGPHDHEVLYCVMRTQSGEVLESLGSIIDPSREYGRVVEAELADQYVYGFRKAAQADAESSRYMAL